MSHSLVIPRYRGAVRKPGGRRPLLLGVALGLAVGVLGFAIAQAAAPQVRAALDVQRAPAASRVEFPARELPREWRWERPAVDFDSMYRHAETPRLDWIQDRGR